MLPNKLVFVHFVLCLFSTGSAVHKPYSTWLHRLCCWGWSYSCTESCSDRTHVRPNCKLSPHHCKKYNCKKTLL